MIASRLRCRRSEIGAAAALLVLASALGGCSTASLNGIATPEAVTTDAGVVGQWRQADGKGEHTYAISADGKDRYRLDVTPDKAGQRKLEFTAQLVELGAATWADLTVTDKDREELQERFGSAVVPAHSFMKVQREGDQLTVWQLKQEYLNAGLRDKSIGLEHADLPEDTVVLTGSTAGL